MTPVSIREAARQKRIGRDIITHLIRMKKLSEIYLPGRKRTKIDLDELDKALEERKVYR